MKGILMNTLLIARNAVVSLVFIAALAFTSAQDLLLDELIFTTDSTTVFTGSITLKCRDSITAEEVEISEISFFLNRTSAAPSLRERGDITVVEVGSTGINFNLTRRLEGYYTCGRRVDTANVRESLPKILICKQV